MNSITTLTPTQLRRAADVQERIDSLRSELERVLGIGTSPAGPQSIRKPTISAKGLANIRAAQRKRWAKAGNGVVAGRPPTKRKISAAARAKIAAAVKARWAAAKKAGKSAL